MMTCWCCGTEVPAGHPAHRGLLVNELARCGARLLELRERLQQLHGKRWSKNFKEQHDRDLKTIAETEAQLPVLEGRIAGLRFLCRETYGG